jgi:hypothetical protein
MLTDLSFGSFDSQWPGARVVAYHSPEGIGYRRRIVI